MNKELDKKKNLIVVGGPTASGKTEIALKVAQEFNGEIINADSLQVYKGMDIGTNKGRIHLAVPFWKKLKIQPEIITIDGKSFELQPFKIEKSEVIGWLFDIVQPDYNFTVSEYQQLAYKVINLIYQRGKVPIMVGGTGLYIDAVIKGYKIETKPDRKLREELGNLSIDELKKRAGSFGVDLNTLNESDRNNPRRLIRLIEKNESEEGTVGSKLEKKNNLNELFLYPDFDKEKLFKNISIRARQMVKKGLIDEVKALFAQGYSPMHKAMQASGYKQTGEYLQGEISSKEELIEAITKAHKNYAKRQITWFEGKRRDYQLIKVSEKNVIDIVAKYL